MNIEKDLLSFLEENLKIYETLDESSIRYFIDNRNYKEEDVYEAVDFLKYNSDLTISKRTVKPATSPYLLPFVLRISK